MPLRWHERNGALSCHFLVHYDWSFSVDFVLTPGENWGDFLYSPWYETSHRKHCCIQLSVLGMLDPAILRFGVNFQCGSCYHCSINPTWCHASWQLNLLAVILQHVSSNAFSLPPPAPGFWAVCTLDGLYKVVPAQNWPQISQLLSVASIGLVMLLAHRIFTWIAELNVKSRALPERIWKSIRDGAGTSRGCSKVSP